MTVSTIRSVKSILPHARIYLNDLWEIEDLLKDAVALADGMNSMSFEYRLGDTRITTRDELLKHGGKSSTFTLLLVRADGLSPSEVLELSRHNRPKFHTPYFLDDRKWELFGRVSHIFDTRKDTLKEAAAAMPDWSVIVVIAAWCLSLPLGEVFHLSLRGWNDLGIGVLVTFLTIMLVVFLLFRKNFIFLVNSREDERARELRSDERLEKFLLLVAGAALGVLGTLVTNHFRR